MAGAVLSFAVLGAGVWLTQRSIRRGLLKPSAPRRAPLVAGSTEVRRPAPGAQGPHAAPHALTLTVSGGAHGGESASATQAKPLLVGRGERCGLRLGREEDVSSAHCEVTWDPTSRRWEVRDLGSLNGTRLNGRLVSVPGGGRVRSAPAPVQDGDTLQLGERAGSVTLRVSLPPAPAAASPPPGQGLASPSARAAPATPLKSPSNAMNAVVERGAAGAGSRLSVGTAVSRSTSRHKSGGPCEDMVVVECPLRGVPDAALLCVFDGHGGWEVSYAASQKVGEALSTRLAAAGAKLPADCGPALEGALAEIESSLDKDTAEYQGCTATVGLVWMHRGGWRMQVANVGDSSCAVRQGPPGRNQWRLVTVDHKVSDPAERERLVARGADVGPGDTRVFGLALSRSIGDLFHKHEAKSGIDATPSVTPPMDMPPGSAAVLASDGLWDVCDASEAGAQVEAAKGPEEAAAALVKLARKRRSQDDTSVVVARTPGGGGLWG